MCPTHKCLFCKILKQQLPVIKIAETAKSLAFMDIGPLSKGHCLIIPKEHAEKFHQLSEDSCADMGRLLNRVSKAMEIETYNILQNNGKIAHQAVNHVHFHIIPKNTKDEGLCLSWKPIEGGFSKEELTQLAEKFAAKMKKLELEAEEGKSTEKK